jgi:hypothetical protein
LCLKSTRSSPVSLGCFMLLASCGSRDSPSLHPKHMLTLLFNTFLFLLFGLFLPFLIIKTRRMLSYSIEKPTETHGSPRRNIVLSPDEPLLTTPHSTIKTLYDGIHFLSLLLFFSLSSLTQKSVIVRCKS